MLSVLILTFNEEARIGRCLDSVSWSDDVLVLDSFSQDQTIEIAKGRGVRVLQNRFLNFAEQRNFGLDHGGLQHDWVLHLDADEVVSAELRDELLSVIARPVKDAYRLASKMIFQGRWLRHAGLYPWYQVRLGRRDRLSFKQVGHGQRERLGPEKVGTLREPLLHYSFSKGLGDWFERHNRYSSAEAAHFCGNLGRQTLDWPGILSWDDGARRRRALKRLFSFLPCRPSLRFLYLYCFRLGFLDGRAGFTYCRLLCMYEYLIVLKVREIRRRQRGLEL